MSKTALLFAGQGAQVVGMGRDLASQSPAVGTLFDRANSVLGYDLARVCQTGPETTLTETEHAQPAIYLVSWMAWVALREQVASLAFDATAGLSLGEFTALAAAGVFTFEEGLRLVRQRGRFMQEACLATEGSMAAVIGLDEGPTREVCEAAGTELANLNCPGQIVISGESAKVGHACELAQARGAKKAVPLNVAGAYHSRLMASAQPKLASALDQVPFQAPRVPVLSNVTARPHGTPADIRARLIEQVTAPVRWEGCMRHLLDLGFRRFIELGPGRTLSGFMKRIDRTAQVLSVADAPSLQETVKVLTSSRGASAP